jgi:hypothetical protein
VPEPSYRQLSQEHRHAFAISIHDVRIGSPHEGELGEGMLLRTDRGDILAVLHQAPEAQRGVIWLGGAREGSAGRARAPSTAWTNALTHWTSRSCSGFSPPALCSMNGWRVWSGPLPAPVYWWTGPRNVSLSMTLEEEGYVDRSGGVCALYVCRV